MDIIASHLHLLAYTAVTAVLLYSRGKAYLLYFQQEEYDAARFVRWWRDKRAFDKFMSLFSLFALLWGWWADMSDVLTVSIFNGLFIGGCVTGIFKSKAVLKSAKKPLVMTNRARRIFALYLILAILLFLGLGFGLWDGIALLDAFAFVAAAVIAVQASPFLIMLANASLKPMESRVKVRFLEEAKEKLARLDPFVIGITGSYGKTSTKSILAHILSSAAPTLATPGSVNTEMGITRIIREQLKSEHRYFIVEMGAYGPGSIARLCKLTPPRLGIITAIGWAHYERFKNIETVFDAKFELADAVLERDGTTIVNTDGIKDDRLFKRMSDKAKGLTLIGTGDNCDLKLIGSEQTKEGLTLKVAGRDLGEVVLKAPLYGVHQTHNILMATAAALQLGMPIDAIRAALASTPQANHRLEVLHHGSLTIIDDAYNSNPSGFASGLELLDVLREKDGRRILITPGMVELGARHDEEHRRLGALAARHVDVAIIVTPQRIPTFIEGFKSEQHRDTVLLQVKRQADAERWLKENRQDFDVILYENNLPDLYEVTPRF